MEGLRCAKKCFGLELEERYVAVNVKNSCKVISIVKIEPLISHWIIASSDTVRIFTILMGQHLR